METVGSAHPRAVLDRHASLLDAVGGDICAGSIPVGGLVSVDELCARHGISRSVVREALRVLASMGLVAPKRGVGTTVQPLASWNLFDPQVIRWRLASPDRLGQLRELAELRVGFEPEAAALAARHVDPDAVSRLMTIGAQLWSAAQRSDSDAFLALDVDFHATLLAASGNPMYAQYAPVVRALLLGRAEHGLAAVHPAHAAVERHLSLLRAIQTGDAERARADSRALILASLEETHSLWEATH